MPKSGLDVTIDNRETFAMIEGLIQQLKRPEPLLKIIGKYIQSQTKKMFIGKRPDTSGVRGEKWPKLAKSTIFKKRALLKAGKLAGNSPNRPLVETGQLRDDLLAPRAIQVQNKGLIYGTNRRSKNGFLYPAIHQLPNNKKIPQRRWLFLNETDLMQIAQATKEWIEGTRTTFTKLKVGTKGIYKSKGKGW